MNKIILLSIFLNSFSIYSMTQKELDEQLSSDLSIGRYDKVDKLLKRGAKASNETIISYCTLNNWHVFKIFLDNGFKINYPVNKFGDNLLMHFIRNFNYDKSSTSDYRQMTDRLLQHGIDINFVNVEGENLLCLICKIQPYYRRTGFLIELAQELIFNGINIRQRNIHGQTPVTSSYGLIKEFLSDYDSFMAENGFYQTGVDYIAAGQAFKQHFEQKKREQEKIDAENKKIKKKRCIIM